MRFTAGPRELIIAHHDHSVPVCASESATNRAVAHIHTSRLCIDTVADRTAIAFPGNHALQRSGNWSASLTSSSRENCDGSEVAVKSIVLDASIESKLADHSSDKYRYEYRTDGEYYELEGQGRAAEYHAA